MLDSRISIYHPVLDVTYLCHFIDSLCTKVILAWHYRQGNSFHSVTAPKLRLVEVLGDFSASSFQSLDATLVVHLCERTIAIASAIHTAKLKCQLLSLHQITWLT
jgi:hypothetical protein